jgi:hypothetical protein
MKHQNRGKEAFLSKLPNLLVENITTDLQSNIIFSLKYFDNSQVAGQNFDNWSHEQLSKLLTKLRHYSSNTLKYWQSQNVGSGRNTILEVYGDFPKRSDFVYPKHIPLDVKWARFRLEGDMRLIGFILSPEDINKHNLPPNVFYIVFLDENHRFYLTK